MYLVEVKYVKNIERSLKCYLKQGYRLNSIENPAEVEMRLYLERETSNICLARQFWDELYPETKDIKDEPNPHIEIHSRSNEEFEELYTKLTSIGLLERVAGDV